ncbi:inosine guanosine and [Periconia macrospinosa]|uniref:Purine nucleoside phosphorylase n=1 Tax=Periconia macrospinosa TaxID=97972 RepID=A0A2V1DX08_9PLEO|nr:inosine guanosine and [Periconia macrospinosa]
MEVTDSSAAPNAYVRAAETANYVRSKLPESLQIPKVAIVCGSGLGGLAETVEPETKVQLAYSTIPNFPRSTVQGHAGNFVFGHIGPQRMPVALLVGRAHFYEGHSMDVVTFATRVCKLLGVETIIVTNAAGGINENFEVGDIVCLNDHLNLPGIVGIHPLRGPNIEEFGVRFPPLSDAYDLDLRRRTHKAWKKLGLNQQKRRLHEGVYAFLSGPTYETRAECRMLRTLGADVVGMSTVPEIVVARHSGLRVLAFSLVTNKAVLEAGPRGDDEIIQNMTAMELEQHLSAGKASHQEVLDAGREAAKDMQALVKQILSDLHEN